MTMREKYRQPCTARCLMPGDTFVVVDGRDGVDIELARHRIKRAQVINEIAIFEADQELGFETAVVCVIGDSSKRSRTISSEKPILEWDWISRRTT